MKRDCMGADTHANGSPMTSKWYRKDEDYEVCEDLAKAFCDDLKVADRTDGKKKAPESKAADPVGENKDAGAAPENKDDAKAKAKAARAAKAKAARAKAKADKAAE